MLLAPEALIKDQLQLCLEVLLLLAIPSPAARLPVKDPIFGVPALIFDLEDSIDESLKLDLLVWHALIEVLFCVKAFPTRKLLLQISRNII